jgi:chromate transporter
MSSPAESPKQLPETLILRLLEVARVFLKLGMIGFGGPAAHIALMRGELVNRRQWLADADFLDLIGAASLIPGPHSTQVAIFVGFRRARWAGFLIAGICFILPAALFVGCLAWLYVAHGALPEVGGFLYAVKPVLIIVIVQALWSLSKRAIKTRSLAVLAFAAAVLNITGMHEIAVLFAAGAAMGGVALLARFAAARQCLLAAFIPAALLAGGAAAAGTAVPFSLPALFGFFLKTGSVLFGSGYVLLAYLRGDLVERWGWLTESQLLDAVAIGQINPGPLFTTATFIGYVLAGAPGAVVATVGIFLPAFFFVAVCGPLLPRLRRSRLFGQVLDGVNAASLAIMGVVAWRLGRASMVDVTTVTIALLSALALFRYRVSPVWLILSGGLAGTLLAIARA